MNNNLNDIIEIIRIYAKNYVRNNPTWDQPVLVKKIREKALREAEDYKKTADQSNHQEENFH